MAGPPPIFLHCSALTRWSLCEKAAIWFHLHPEPATEAAQHIATWMGSMVHARVAEETETEPPKAIIYDGITPTMDVARIQIVLMARAIAMRLAAEDWTITGREVQLRPLWLPGWPDNFRLVGRLDLKARNSRAVVICDLKTSRDIFPAWVQLGAYRLLDRMAGNTAADRVATIHCPRPADIARGRAECEIYFADADAAEDEALRIANRIVELIDDPEIATAAPGNRCSFCKHPQCVVRSRDISPQAERMGQ